VPARRWSRQFRKSLTTPSCEAKLLWRYGALFNHQETRVDVKLDDGDSTLYVEPSLEEGKAVYVLLLAHGEDVNEAGEGRNIHLTREQAEQLRECLNALLTS
jgi:hypothetical protein